MTREVFLSPLRYTKFLQLFCIALFLWLGNGCGGKSDKDNTVKLDVKPSSSNMHVRKSKFEYLIESAEGGFTTVTVNPNWLALYITVENPSETTAITVIAVDIEATSPSSNNTYQKSFFGSLEIPPGGSQIISEVGKPPPVYLDGLPGAGNDATYTFSISVDGWVGGILDVDGDPLTFSTLNFSADTY